MLLKSETEVADGEREGRRAGAQNMRVGERRTIVKQGNERRRHPRYVLQPMYAPIAVRLLESERFTIEGHAYDISVGGIRFELDRAIEPGTQVAMQITLPPADENDIGPGRTVFVFANVVWLEDEDEPGPARMAAVFANFARAGDEQRLQRLFKSGRYRLAA